jgi:hypothetical protein
LIVILSLGLVVSPAAAAKPLEVHISSDFYQATFSGTFEAFGSAVNAGIICHSGVFEDYGGVLISSGLLIVYKHFMCDDNSDTFEMKLMVKFDETGSTATWRIVDGSGSYSKLHGLGSLVGTRESYGMHDEYTGTLH